RIPVNRAQQGGQQAKLAGTAKKPAASTGNYISDSGSEGEGIVDPMFDEEGPRPPASKPRSGVSLLRVSSPPAPTSAPKKPRLNTSKRSSGLLSNSYRPETRNLIKSSAGSKPIEAPKPTSQPAQQSGPGSVRSPQRQGQSSSATQTAAQVQN